MNDFSSLQTLNHQLSSLFLGDLSIYSTEKDIRQLFRNYGVIETVRIKRGGSGKPHLSYGFIKFRDRESAELAMRELNGTLFLGRALRIGWAEPKSNTKIIKPRKDGKAPETAQIHVSFISKQVDALITEATLRGLFSMYGEVVDVAIKKTQYDKKLKIQNGYGFVHFALTPEGVKAAVTATKSIHQVTIDRVTYDCSLSHTLEEIVGPEVAAEIYSPKHAAPNSHPFQSANADSFSTGAGSLYGATSGDSGYSTGFSAVVKGPAGGGDSGFSTGFSGVSNIPKPPPLNMSPHLPPLPPHYHYSHSPHSPSPHTHSTLAFPHEELERRGLQSTFPGSPSSALSPKGQQGHYSSEYGNHEFYGIAEIKKSPRPTPVDYGTSTYYSSNYADHPGKVGYQNNHSHPQTRNSSSSASISSHTEVLSVSDSGIEEPFERLSLSDSRTSKPSPTSSLRSGENRSLSNDRSPIYGQHKHYSYQGSSNSNSNMYSFASNSLDSTLSMSSLSTNASQQRSDMSSTLQQRSEISNMLQQRSDISNTLQQRSDVANQLPVNSGLGNIPLNNNTSWNR